MFARPDVQTSGKIFAARVAVGEAGDQFVLRQRAGFEELLHQRFVGFGHHFDQRFARRVDGVGH